LSTIVKCPDRHGKVQDTAKLLARPGSLYTLLLFTLNAYVKVDPGIADVLLISVYRIPGRTSRWFGCENKVRDPRTKAGDGIRLANLFDLSSAPKNSIPYRDKTSFATFVLLLSQHS
jgi:hypothetical protein